MKNPRNLRSFMTKLWTTNNTSQAGPQKQKNKKKQFFRTKFRIFFVASPSQVFRDAKALSKAVALVDELIARFPESIPLLPLDVLESSLERIRAVFPAGTFCEQKKKKKKKKK